MMRTRGLTLLLFLVICASPIDPTAFAQVTPKPSPSIEIPMELLFSRPVVRGTVNGKGPFAMLIDPQLKTTTISAALADRLHLERERDVSGISKCFVDFAFGTHNVSKVAVEVRDTPSSLPELQQTSQPAVVLSLSMWADQLVTVDYGRFQLRVESGELPEPNGRDVYALSGVSNELRVTLAIGDLTIEARVDLLFPGAVLLPESFLTELPLANKPTEAAAVGTREGAAAVRQARISERMTLAGADIDPRLVLFGNIDRATVGYSALARLSITYDVTRRRARLNRKQ